MRTVAWLGASLLLAASGCSRGPAVYEPPIDRRPIEGAAPELADFVEMSSPVLRKHAIRDILDAAEGQPARWTNRNPTLRFYPRRVSDRRLRADFIIAGETMKETGPVTIAFKLNGRLLDTVRYDSPGEKRFDKPVPPGWLKAGEPATVSLEIDKVWVSKTDGARLGVMLLRAGFQP